MRNGLPGIKEAPWSLRGIVGVQLAGLVFLDVTVSQPAGLLVLGVLVVFGWNYALLIGVRWIWFLTVGIYICTLPRIVVGTAGWGASVLTVVGLILLFVPVTRHYFFAERKNDDLLA
jgi:hypothetical protein